MNKHRVNIPMCLAGILLCLTLFSFRLMGGLDAKYSTSDSGSDSARVITFGDVTITEDGDFTASDTSAPILPGVDLTKNITVSFEGSDAATFVFVEIVRVPEPVLSQPTFMLISKSALSKSSL